MGWHGNLMSISELKKFDMKILVVEDDIYMNETLCDILKESGHKVDNTLEADEAMFKLCEQKNSYNLLVLDYNLGSQDELTGIDIYDAAKKENPDTKAIMISGHGNRLLREKALHEGINFYFDKPFLINEFMTAVNDLS